MSGSALGPLRNQWSSSTFMKRLSTHSTSPPSSSARAARQSSMGTTAKSWKLPKRLTSKPRRLKRRGGHPREVRHAVSATQLARQAERQAPALTLRGVEPPRLAPRPLKTAFRSKSTPEILPKAQRQGIAQHRAGVPPCQAQAPVASIVAQGAYGPFQRPRHLRGNASNATREP